MAVIAKMLRLAAQVYNASNNELVRTNTLVKSAIIQVDATPFRQWYEAHVSGLFLSDKCRKLNWLYTVRSARNQAGREEGYH